MGKGNHTYRQGEKHPNAKLTEEEVLVIKALWDDGFKEKELAGFFKISACSISNIIHNRRWQHLPKT